MEKRNQHPRAAKRPAARLRAELGVIATYIVELSEQFGGAREPKGDVRRHDSSTLALLRCPVPRRPESG